MQTANLYLLWYAAAATTAPISQLLAAAVLAWHPGGLPCTCVIWQTAMDLGSLYSDLGAYTVICVYVLCV